MTIEQWFGVVAIVIGAYFIVCSTVAREFVLYRHKAKKAAAVLGEAWTHRVYLLFGVILALLGAVKVAGVF
jgi:hypothetical protein